MVRSVVVRMEEGLDFRGGDAASLPDTGKSVAELARGLIADRGCYGAGYYAGNSPRPTGRFFSVLAVNRSEMGCGLCIF